MTKKNVLLIIAMLTLAMLTVGCDGSEARTEAEESLTVESEVQRQTENSEEKGCNLTWIGGQFNVVVKLQQLRACEPTAEQQAKYDKMLESALSKCFETCDDNYPNSEDGAKSEDNVDCVAQCKGN